MQREGPEDPPAGAQVATPGTIMLQEVLLGFNLSEFSESQLITFINTLPTETGSKPHFRKFLSFLLKFVEYNRPKYKVLRTELGRLNEQAISMREELNRFMATRQEPLPRVAPVPNLPPPSMAPPLIMAPPPTMASQPSLASLPTAQQATAPMPPASLATAQPSAFQAAAPPFASQAIPGPFVIPTVFSPAIVNVDGTISRKMDQVGNNITVTFSGNDEMASKKSKLFGSSAKLDIFTGKDKSQFPEWVAQFLSGINLFQPTEPNACKVALHLLRGKAAEMAKNVPQQVSMLNLQELLTSLDRIFNTTGNRIVAVNIFNSFSQREHMSVQDYSIGMEQRFYRAYPGVDPDGSIFLMDRFITGLVSPQVKERLRIPPQPGHFREAVNKAMAFSAAIFPGNQTLVQRSMAWKMAASTSHSLLTKSINKDPKGSIQMVDCSSDGAASMHAIHKWCAYHKSEKHSDSDCGAQQESATSTTQTSKKCPKGSIKRKTNKPRRLKFKSKTDKKKFLRSIEDKEGVSLESASSDGEDIVEQSLMQLDAVSSSEVLDEEGDSNLHILMMNPDPLLSETDIVMESVLSRAISESASLNPYVSNISTEELDLAVNSIRLGGEKIDPPEPRENSHLPCLLRRILLLSVLQTQLFWIVLLILL